MRQRVLLAAAALVAALLAAATPAARADAPASPALVTADAETTPVPESGDAADDPAIWVDRRSAANSLLIGNDKQGSLRVYNLDGTVRQVITSAKPFWGNVDVRQGVTIGGRTFDLVGATNRGLRLFRVNRKTRTLVPIDETQPTKVVGQGLCLYHSRATGGVHAYTLDGKGVLRQFQLVDQDGDGRVEIQRSRTFTVVVGPPPSEATEACAADDANGALYVSEENVALWRYGAEPGDGTARTLVDTAGAGGHLVADIEGVAVTDRHLVVSAQNLAAPGQSYFAAYDRTTNAYQGVFRIVGGGAADGCERTDGVAAYAGDLGPAYPQGVFVCQDHDNESPAPGNQNFKLTRLERIPLLR